LLPSSGEARPLVRMMALNDISDCFPHQVRMRSS
jgi:hypothetical protein